MERGQHVRTILCKGIFSLDVEMNCGGCFQRVYLQALKIFVVMVGICRSGERDYKSKLSFG